MVHLQRVDFTSSCLLSYNLFWRIWVLASSCARSSVPGFLGLLTSFDSETVSLFVGTPLRDLMMVQLQTLLLYGFAMDTHKSVSSVLMHPSSDHL